MIRLTVPVVALAAVVLAATGCGGSKKSSSSTAATTPAATTPATTAPATTTPATTTSSSSSSSSSGGSGTSTTSSSGSSGSTGGSTTIAKSCLDFAGAAAKLGQAFGAGGTSSTESLANLKTYMNGLADKAPSSIKSSFQTLAAAFGKYVDALKNAGFTPGKTPSAADMAKLEGALKSIETPEVKAAETKIQAWVQAGCH